MNVNVVISMDGTLKVKNIENMSGKEFCISANDARDETENRASNAAEIMELFIQGDQMDFPRKTHEELMRELRETRE